MKRTLIFYLLITLIFSADAIAQTVSKEILAQRVIELSGVKVSIKIFPPLVTEEIIQGEVFSDYPEIVEKAAEIARELFDLKLASKIILQHLNEQATIEDLSAALKWLETPLGSRIVKAENDATTLEVEKKIEAYINKFKSPSEDRIQLMHKLEKEVDSTNLALFALISIFLAMFETSVEFNSNEEHMTPQDSGKIWKDIEPEIRKLTNDYIILSNPYVYRDFSNEEMERYIVFLKSKPGEKVRTIVIDGMVEVLDGYSRAYFKRLFQMLESLEKAEEQVQAVP
jgi:hypothetical protein